MNRVFLDSSPLIYLAEENAGRQQTVQNQLTRWIHSHAILATSTLTILEVLVVPKREKNSRLERQYRSLTTSILSEPLLTMSEEAAVLASEYRATLNLRTPDAIQLATAVTNGFTIFYTNDQKLKRCPDIEIMVVDE